MADDLERELHSIKGEGPSPDFVANLRKRVAAELAQSIVTVDDEFVVDVDLRPKEEEDAMTKKRWILMGAAAAVALLAGFVALGRSGDEGSLEDVITAEESTPIPDPTAVPDPTVDPAPTTAATEEAIPTPAPEETVELGSFVADAEPLIREYERVNTGVYRVDAIGTAFSFALGGSLNVQQNDQTMFVLSHEFSNGPDDQDLIFLRLTALFDPAQPSVRLESLQDGWSPEDFDGWLDNLADGMLVSNREVTTLGGLPAVRVDLEIQESVCGEDPDFCVGFGTNGLVGSKFMFPGAKYQIWVVEQGDQVPMAVIASINNEADGSWFDTTQEILSTLEFGEIAPNPLVRVPLGPADLSLLGGIRIEVTPDLILAEELEDFEFILLGDEPAATEFLTSPLDFVGNSIESTDDLVALLAENTGELTEIESTLVGGIETRVFEFSAGSEQGVFKRNAEDERGWRTPTLGRMWVIQHPERGLLVVVAGAGGPTAATIFPLVLAQTEAILASLEFVELQ